MAKSGAQIMRLMDIDKRPIHIVASELRDSKMGPYLVMEDNLGRIILTGDSATLAQYGGIPAPFYIT